MRCNPIADRPRRADRGRARDGGGGRCEPEHGQRPPVLVEQEGVRDQRRPHGAGRLVVGCETDATSAMRSPSRGRSRRLRRAAPALRSACPCAALARENRASAAARRAEKDAWARIKARRRDVRVPVLEQLCDASPPSASRGSGAARVATRLTTEAGAVPGGRRMPPTRSDVWTFPATLKTRIGQGRQLHVERHLELADADTSAEAGEGPARTAHREAGSARPVPHPGRGAPPRALLPHRRRVPPPEAGTRARHWRGRRPRRRRRPQPAARRAARGSRRRAATALPRAGERARMREPPRPARPVRQRSASPRSSVQTSRSRTRRKPSFS